MTPPGRDHDRSIGVVYLSYFLSSIVGQALTAGFVVPTDGNATASNIAARPAVFQAGMAMQLASIAIYVVIAVLLYWLLRPVDGRAAMLALAFGLLGSAAQSMATTFPMAIGAMVGGSGGGHAISPAAIVVLTAIGTAGIRVGLVFFALFDVTVGYLLVRSRFVHPAFGALMVLGGVGWLTFAYPPLASAIAPLVYIIGGGAEVALMLRLLLVGLRLSARSGNGGDAPAGVSHPPAR